MVERLKFGALIFALALGFAGANRAAAGVFSFPLEGRLTEKNGKPVDGPVALSVAFYHVEEGGTPVFTMSAGLDKVALQEGLFQLRLALSATDYQTIFPSVLDRVFVEITDLTHASDAPYPRYEIGMAPYAGKIPVDNKILMFDAQGRATLNAAGANTAGKVLTADGAGGLIWTTPAAGAGGTVDWTAPGDIGTTTPATGVFSSLSTTGAMGINKAVPGSQLEIKGAGATAATSSLNVTDAAGVSKLLVRDDGNVGIGTTTPDAPLVVNDASGRGIRVGNFAAPANTMVSIGGFADYTGLSIKKNAVGTGNYLDIQDSIGGSQLAVAPSGVGIGTSAPTEKLEVAGGARIGKAPAILLTVSGAYNASVTTISASAATSGYPTTGTLLIGAEAITYTGLSGSDFTGCTRGALGTTAGSYVGGETINNYLEVVASSSTSPKMVVTGSGNVGIGTVSPASPLTVNGSAVIGGTANVQGSTLYVSGSNFTQGAVSANSQLAGVETYGIRAINWGTTPGTAASINFGMMTSDFNPAHYGRIGAVSTDVTPGAQAGDLYFKTATAGAFNERMRITGAGNVGIGTSAPAGKLDVNGSICFAGDCKASWASVAANLAAPAAIGGTTPNTGTFTTLTASNVSLGGNTAATIQEARHTSADTAGNDLTVGAGGATSAATNKNGGNLTLASGTATGTGTSAISFQTASAGASGTTDGAPTTKVTILGSGNVGIGTTSPAATLSVINSNSTLLAQFLGTNSDATHQGEINIIQPAPGSRGLTMNFLSRGSTKLAISPSDSSQSYSLIASTGSALQFSGENFGFNLANTQVRAKEYLEIGGNERLGLAPGSLATVAVTLAAGDTTASVSSTSGYPSTGTLLVDNEAIGYFGVTATTFTNLTRGDLGSTAATHNVGAVANNYLLTVGRDSTHPILNVQGNGNVGIGTTSPTAKLQVTGQIVSSLSTTLTPSGTSQAIDFASGNSQVVSLAAAAGTVALTFSNAVAGGSYVIKIIQGAAASVVTWPAGVKWPGGNAHTVSTASGAVDLVTLFYDGSTYYANSGNNYQ